MCASKTPVRSTRPLDARRRRLLLNGLRGAGVIAVGPLLWGCAEDGDITLPTSADTSTPPGAPSPGGGSPRPTGNMPSLGVIGPLREADENGVRLPEGLTSRIVAVEGEKPYAGSDYLWHPEPDGGATFAVEDGFIYVSNSEVNTGDGFGVLPGGAGAIRFDTNGDIVDAYSILSNTSNNCAGGPTPWGTWLSCEEQPFGNVHECDPTGRKAPIQRRAMGTFSHEAAAVDPEHQMVYLTEDTSDGGFYRFVPEEYPDLGRGRLEIAEVHGEDPSAIRDVVWHRVPFPNPPFGVIGPTREQVSESTAFDGGEGIWFHDGIVYFTTKGDNRVWAYDAEESTLEIIYDDDMFKDPVLTGVDNITVNDAGDKLVAEDGGNMQLVVITPDRKVSALLQVEHEGSEITGPAFSPDGRRLYFSSQRGPSINGNLGVTFEVSGPLFDRAVDAQRDALN